MSSPIRLSNPCEVPWGEMASTARGKHCAKCDRVVHDLTRATEREARGIAALFGADRLCARVGLDGDGEVVFRAPKPKGGSLRARIAAAAVGLGAAGCSEVSPKTPSPPAPRHVDAPLDTTPREVDRPSPLVVAEAPLDSDQDGVADAVDQCPDVPGGSSTDGCPRVVVTSAGDMVILQTVRFAPGSFTFLKESEPILEATVEVMKSHPEIKAVEVHGHADDTEASADQLSRKRANRVVDWLTKKGIEPGRLIPIGDGSAKPIEPNATVEGRAKNRRIEFRVIPDPATGSSS